jgi:hypothetical protein
MTVMSTQFQYKTIHKGTLILPDLTTVNQTDHILINTNKKKTVQDVRTLWGPNCDSDHLFVKSTIKQWLITMPRRNIENRKKWNLDNIRNLAKLKQYRQMIYEKAPPKNGTDRHKSRMGKHKHHYTKSWAKKQSKKETSMYVMTGRMKHVKRPFQRKILPERNVCKKNQSKPRKIYTSEKRS